jgi:hypothetical protein
MKYFRSEYSIYHEDMHENTGVWCRVRALGIAHGTTAHRIGENGVHFGPERIGDGHVLDRYCMR